jgi:hypothetical protein
VLENDNGWYRGFENQKMVNGVGVESVQMVEVLVQMLVMVMVMALVLVVQKGCCVSVQSAV